MDEDMGDCRDCAYSFDRHDVGAGCRRWRAGVQAIVLPPATTLGRTPKSSLARRSTASTAARAAPSRGSTTPQPINPGITWSEETFPKYIRAPMQEMPGTRMAFVGIKNDKDSADLWAYLKQFGTDGAKK